MYRFLAASLLAVAPVPALAAQPAPAAPVVAPDPGTPAANFSSERIGVTVLGEGPDVVLIPGLSSTPDVWRSTIAALPGYRYHLIHVSGFAGRPPGANAQGPYLVPVAEEIARYIAEAGLDRPAIVGHSMGGSWALLVAGRHPDRAGKVMVVDMLPYVGVMFRQRDTTDEQVAAMAEQMRTRIAAATPDQRRMFSSMTISQMVRTESERPAQIEASLASDPAVSAQGFADLMVTNLMPEVGNIRAPLVVLYVDPAGSQFTSEQIDRAYQLSYQHAPQAVIRRVPDSAHFIMLDNAAFFQAQLRTFLGTAGAPRP